MFSKEMFHGDDISEVAKRLLGCELHFPKAGYPVDHGTITAVQWYGTEDQDPATIEDKQGDNLLIPPGHVFIYEAMGQNYILISALSDKTRACIRINEVEGIGDRARMISRALGITTMNRHKFQNQSIFDENSYLFITKPEIEIPEVESYTPNRSELEKAFKISLPKKKKKKK